MKSVQAAGVGAVVAVVAVLAGPAAARTDTADLSKEIANLVKELGSDRFERREAATHRLVEIGAPALPALQRAMNSRDLEVSVRARMAAEMIGGRTPGARTALRKIAQEHFRRGQYGKMASAYEKVAAGGDAPLLDLLWLGHAYQLDANWPKAVRAYRHVVAAIDKAIEGGGPATPPAAGGEGEAVEGVGKAMAGRPMARVDLEKGLLSQRTGLLLWISRLQRQHCANPKAAAGTVAEALAYLEEAGTAIEGSYLIKVVRRELALALEQAGKPLAALKAWAAVYRAHRGGPDRPPVSTLPVSTIARLLRKLPAGAAVPDVPQTILLSPQSPSRLLDLDDAGTLDRAFRAYETSGSGYWSFALCPVPGKEIATLKLVCDLEQIKVGYGGQLRCWVESVGSRPKAVELYSLLWSRQDKPARKPVQRKIDIPPGAPAVFVRAGRWSGKFKVHSVKVAATFRAPQKPGKGLTPPIWMQTEALPKGGKLTRDVKPLGVNMANTDTPPGRSVFRYEVPGRKDAWQAEGELVPGRRYGLFANLDSPFLSALTNLHDVGGGHVLDGCLSAARMKDGRWLAAWATIDRRVMYATSRDLVEWTEPRPLPFCSIFPSVSPSLAAGPDGKVHVAWFSKRLDPDATSTTGYRLWRMSTADGVRWAKPRPISIGVAANRDSEPAQMLFAPTGRFWVFWRDYAGEGANPDDLHELHPTWISDQNELRVRRVHVSLDKAAQMHLVFDDGGGGVFHVRSKNGWEWTKAVRLLDRQDRRSPSHPQLILAGDRAALVYERSDGAFRCPVKLGEEPTVGEAVKITNHVVPLNGARVAALPDGRPILFAGRDSAWLLKAKAPVPPGK